jgi:hypothetical protein
MPGEFPPEALGGVTLDNIAEIPRARVDYTSADWITIRPPNPDVALQMKSAVVRSGYRLFATDCVVSGSLHSGASPPSPQARGR